MSSDLGFRQTRSEFRHLRFRQRAWARISERPLAIPLFRAEAGEGRIKRYKLAGQFDQ